MITHGGINALLTNYEAQEIKVVTVDVSRFDVVNMFLDTVKEQTKDADVVIFMECDNIPPECLGDLQRYVPLNALMITFG